MLEWILSGRTALCERCAHFLRRPYTIHRYDEARQLKEKQDTYCAKVLEGDPTEDLDPFPEDLQYEALIDTLRGKVKVDLFANKVRIDYNSIGCPLGSRPLLRGS